MEMKYYNASNNFSAPITREPRPYQPYASRMEVIVPETPREEIREVRMEPMKRHEESKSAKAHSNSFLGDFQTDDWLLIGLILILILDSSDDILLLLILGYLLLTGWNQNEG